MLDVGSNLGYYVVHEAMLAGREGLVIALEPQPHVFKALVTSIKANGLNNVLALNIALSRSPGRSRFLVSIFSNWSRIASDRDPPGDDEIFVTTTTLDELVEKLGIDRLDLIRMDVEGHELEILEGGWRTIERFKPDICMELHISFLGLRRAIYLLTKLLRIGYKVVFAAPRLIDYYPISSNHYRITSRGDVKQQLLQIFSKPYMNEVIHICLSSKP